MYTWLETFCKDMAGDEHSLMLEFAWAKLVSHYKDSPFQRSLLKRYSHTGEEIWQGIAELFSIRVTIVLKKRQNSTVWTPVSPATSCRYEVYLRLDPDTFLIETVLPKSPVMSLLHLFYSLDMHSDIPEVTFRTLLVNHLLSPQTRFRYLCNANDDYLFDVIRQHVDIIGVGEKRIFDYMVEYFTRSISFRAVFRPSPEPIVLTPEERSVYEKRHKQWNPKVFNESSTPPWR